MSRDPVSSLVDSPLAELLARIESELNLVRRDLEGRVAPIEAALAAYKRAVEEQAVRSYAANHSIARPSGAGVAPDVAARNLQKAVLGLPELHLPELQPTQSRVQNEETETRRVEADPSPARGAQPRSFEEALPFVAAACSAQKMVIVGALKGRKKPLPSPLDASVEWVDTSDGGAHAIGNLPQRIRQGRVFGVIICDQAVQHKHSEPLVSAARAAKVPVGFAGKGGARSLARALEAIEEQLSTSPERE